MGSYFSGYCPMISFLYFLIKGLNKIHDILIRISYYYNNKLSLPVFHTNNYCRHKMANMNTNLFVRNINGTSGERYRNSGSKTAASWLQVWRDKTGSGRETCCVLKCTRTDLVGGHVMIVDGRSSNEWWLAPICNDHNNFSNTDPMALDSRINLVSVRDE